MQTSSPNLAEDRVIWRLLQENTYCILNGDCQRHLLSAPGPLANVASLFCPEESNAWIHLGLSL